jgi:hypothetical protein
MARWFDLEPFEDDFFTRAPERSSYTLDLPVPAERVWAELTGERPLAWCRALTGGTYTSDRPYGVRTTRTMGILGGVLKFRERYIRWEEGRRQSFYVEQATMPIFRKFGEDYVVEETAGGSRLTWTLVHELRFPATALANRPLNKALERSMVKDTKRHFSGG